VRSIISRLVILYRVDPKRTPPPGSPKGANAPKAEPPSLKEGGKNI